MSRCFPYPPLGYTRNGDCGGGDALIESIKLQKEREKFKTDKRKEKKEKKEKKDRKDKKHETERRKDNKEKEVKKLGGKLKRPREDCHEGEKCSGDIIGKGRDYQAEQLENSGLTEEHGQPSCSQNVVYLSDGTQSSHKRRRQDLPSSGSQNHGNIIRFSLHKHREPATNASVKREEICSTSQGMESCAQQKVESASTSSQVKYSNSTKSNSIIEECNVRPVNEQSCSISGKGKSFAGDIAKASHEATLHQSKKQRVESKYRAVVEDWVPPPIEQNSFDDEEDWLFQPKQKRDRIGSLKLEPGSLKLEPGNDVSCRAASDLWPRARYIAEADIYALPYTAPF